MDVELRAIADVKPYEKNPRLNDPAVDAVAKSITEFGFRQPIVVDSQGIIVVGHTRLKAAKKLGMDKVPVHVASELTPEQAKAYRIADNATADRASWDLDILPLELSELDTMNVDLSTLGFSDDYLQQIMGPKEGLTDPDEVPEAPADPITKVGDLWTLGDHRLLCGDSTSEVDTATLMGGMLGHLVFTDPPYGVAYDGGTKARTKLVGDETTSLYLPACERAAVCSDAKAALYLWHAGVKGIAAAAAAAAAGYEIRCELVWNKNHFQYGSLSSQYKPKHEPCYYCFKRGKTPRWFGPTNEITVWDCDRSPKNDYHPTQKPVALAARAIANSSQTGHIVLDLFLGSGSTMIAAEQLGRRFYGIEIEPRYVDVAVQRWEKFAGKTAERTGG